MATTGSIFLQNKNLKGYLFFLLLTAVMAIITKLTKDYTAITEIDIEIVDVPENLSIYKIEDTLIQVSHELSGFSLLGNSLRRKSLAVGFNQLEKNSEDEYRLNLSGQLRPLSALLSCDPTSINLNLQELKFVVNEQEMKEVPVVVPLDIDYLPGYGALEEMVVEPSIVKVIGPKSSIDTIKVVTAKRLTFENVNSDVAAIAELIFKDDRVKIDISPAEVKVKQKVAKFTEGTIDVPIKVIYQGDGEIQVFPKSVRIQYAVAIEHFDKVKVSDFEIRCDFEDGNKNSQYLQLKIIKKPSYVSKERLMTKQVQYVIVNK